MTEPTGGGETVDPRLFWMTTVSGGRFYPGDPENSVYKLEDIAHGLSMAPRFGGQSPQFLSVAEHSVGVCRIVAPKYPHLAMVALLHDAAEAFLTDMPRPVKYLPSMAGYRELEKRTWQAIAKAFDVPTEIPEDVKAADVLALRNEAKQLGMLKPDWDVYDWPDINQPLSMHSPAAARGMFIEEFERIRWRTR